MKTACLVGVPGLKALLISRGAEANSGLDFFGLVFFLDLVICDSL